MFPRTHESGGDAAAAVPGPGTGTGTGTGTGQAGQAGAVAAQAAPEAPADQARRGARWARVSGRRAGMALVPLAILASGAMVYQASNAAFTATTSNGANTFSAGTVVLADDDSGSLLFNPTNLKPGDTATKCINVTYSGSLASAVKFYVNPLTGTGGAGGNGLGQYLDWTVTEGTGATGGATFDCTNFVAGSTLSSGGTLAAFATASGAYATGVSSWTPAGGATTTRSYRFTYTLQDQNAAQGATANATLVWEARNT